MWETTEICFALFFDVSHEIHATQVSVCPRRVRFISEERENKPLSSAIRVASR